jgi:hypothetical protein
MPQAASCPAPSLVRLLHPPSTIHRCVSSLLTLTHIGIGAVVTVLMLIGGRIVPSFTRNWLVRENPGRLPMPFGRFYAGRGGGHVDHMMELGMGRDLLLMTAVQVSIVSAMASNQTSFVHGCLLASGCRRRLHWLSRHGHRRCLSASAGSCEALRADRNAVRRFEDRIWRTRAK